MRRHHLERRPAFATTTKKTAVWATTVVSNSGLPSGMAKCQLPLHPPPPPPPPPPSPPRASSSSARVAASTVWLPVRAFRPSADGSCSAIVALTFGARPTRPSTSAPRSVRPSVRPFVSRAMEGRDERTRLSAPPSLCPSLDHKRRSHARRGHAAAAHRSLALLERPRPTSVRIGIGSFWKRENGTTRIRWAGMCSSQFRS